MPYLTAAYISCAVVIYICLVVFVFVFNMSQPRAPRDHLCGVAEISPDITPAERERCRKLRSTK